jgi:very-short-patch-repair endonuclease
VLAYRQKVTELARREVAMDLIDKEQSLRRRYQTALNSLRAENQQNYALSHLSADGFFPGYAMARESCTATCLDPFKEFSRPAAIALREFAPTSRIYADGNVIRITRIALHDPWERISENSPYEATREFYIDSQSGRLLDPAGRSEEGGTDEVRLRSVSLAGADIDTRETIGDIRDSRANVGYDVRPVLLSEHGGGWQASVGDHTLRYFRRHQIRLVNLGPVGATVESAEGGFVVCPICGAVRSPRASEAELAKFVETHRRQCGASEVKRHALHVEFPCDLLVLGPFSARADAINAMSGLLVGAKHVLDMGDAELEGLVLPEDANACSVLLYDPVPGGSGFLTQLSRYWQASCEKGAQVIGGCRGCGEEEACYGCLKTYRNQQYHEELSRATACQMLVDLAADVVQTNDIPPVVLERSGPLPDTESDAEQNLEALLIAHSFPLPAERQYRVDLGGGDSTVADFAYPDERVLVFVDGMSERIHGNSQQRLRDTILRAKAKMAGYSVVAPTAQTLSDEIGAAAFLNELAVFLGRADLLLDLPG